MRIIKRVDRMTLTFGRFNKWGQSSVVTRSINRSQVCFKKVRKYIFKNEKSTQKTQNQKEVKPKGGVKQAEITDVFIY